MLNSAQAVNCSILNYDKLVEISDLDYQRQVNYPANILKTIKNATDIHVISTFQGHLVRFVYSEVSLPLAREWFSEN